MPTIANATVVGHLYAPPELKEGEKGKWCRIRFWTSDKVKGKEDKQFTSWGGVVSGPQAEWIARDGRKGTLVYVSGSIRLDKFTKSDGSESHSVEFTRISECRSLEAKDAKDDKPAAQSEPRPARPAAPAGGGSGSDEPPFMRRGEWE